MATSPRLFSGTSSEREAVYGLKNEAALMRWDEFNLLTYQQYKIHWPLWCGSGVLSSWCDESKWKTCTASSCASRGKRKRNTAPKEGELQRAFRTRSRLTVDTIVLLAHTKRMGFLSYGHIRQLIYGLFTCACDPQVISPLPPFRLKARGMAHCDSLLLCWLAPQKSCNDLENQPISAARCPRHCGEVTLPSRHRLTAGVHLFCTF